MDRRGFLKSLGMASAGVAFASALPSNKWLVPQDLIPWDGPVTHEWISAEALRLLANSFDLSAMAVVPAVTNLQENWQQLGVDCSLDETTMKGSRESVSQNWLEPAMAQFAMKLEEVRPRRCGLLEIPASVPGAHAATNAERNFNLRYLRAFDIGGGPRSYTDEEGLTVEWYDPPRWINRFDMLVAA